MNGISSYSMWWVLIHHEWYRYTADRAYLRQQRDYLVPLLQQLCKCVDAKGREKLPGTRFLDWPSQADKQGDTRRFAVLARSDLGRRGRAVRTCSGNRTRSGNAELWLSSASSTFPDPGPSKQAAALMALADLRDAGQLNEQVLAVGGARG